MTYQNIEHIAAGQFKLGKNQNDIYQAYLGNYLGVALYDKETQIGGKSASKNAYTARLLHNIGKVVQDQHIADTTPLFFKDISHHSRNFLDTEKKLLGITHCETGAFLAKRWDFSNALSQVIFHHHPENAKSNQDLISIVYLSDVIMEKFSAGFDLESIQTQSFSYVLDRLELTASDIPGIVDVIPLNIFKQNELTGSER
jgi:hypothetical protein